MVAKLNTRSYTTAKRKRVRTPRPPRNNRRFAHDLMGVTLIAIGGICTVSLVALSKAGQFGQILNTSLHTGFGIGCFGVPILLTFIGLVLIVGRTPTNRREWIGGTVSLWVIFLAWWHFAHTTVNNQMLPASLSAYGGYVGACIAMDMRLVVGAATPIVFTALTLAAIVWLTDIRLLHIFAGLTKGVGKAGAPLARGVSRLRGRKLPTMPQFTCASPRPTRRPTAGLSSLRMTRPRLRVFLRCRCVWQ